MGSNEASEGKRLSSQTKKTARASHSASNESPPLARCVCTNLFFSSHLRRAAEFYARRTQTPPTALIACSAFFEKSLALTITGWLGRRPLPRTLKKP